MEQTYQNHQRKKHSHRMLNLLFPLLLLGLAGCGSSREQSLNNPSKSISTPVSSSVSPISENKVKIVTTFLPMYWFTRAVAGDLADIELLVPPGTEIHEYQTTPENIKTLATANVLVKNGLGLEEFLADAIKSAENPKLQTVDASKGIKPLDPISPVEKIGKHDEGHHHHEGNPHVWLDPVLVIQQVNNIRDGLIEFDPKNKTTYQANASAYVQQLEKLHSNWQENLQKYPNCKFITFHDAFPYLAKRYNLKQVAIVELPEDQLSPEDLKTVVNTVKKYQVKALFGEPGTNNKLLNSLSQDLNITLRPLDSLESGDRNPQYYFQGMQTNLENLVAACK